MTVTTGWGEVSLDELKTGDKIQVDNGFTCVPAWSTHEVGHDEAEAYREKCHEAGFYIKCSETATHWLVGQVDDCGKLVGIRRAE